MAGWKKRAPLVAVGSANDKNVFETNREPFGTHSIYELSMVVALILSFLSATNSTRTYMYRVAFVRRKITTIAIGLGVIYALRMEQERNVTVYSRVRVNVLGKLRCIKVTSLSSSSGLQFYSFVNFRRYKRDIGDDFFHHRFYICVSSCSFMEITRQIFEQSSGIINRWRCWILFSKEYTMSLSFIGIVRQIFEFQTKRVLSLQSL